MAEKIDGHQRVAAFLLSLEPEVATSILRTLGEDLAERVAKAMIDLDPRLRDTEEVAALYRSIAIDLHRDKDITPCGEEELARLLEASFGPEKGRQVLAEIVERRLRERPFLAIESKPVTAVARILKQESNPVCALVLSSLPPAMAARILGEFSDEKALDTVRRIATLKSPGAQVVRAIADDLEARLANAEEEELEIPEGERLKSVATILGFSKPDIEKGVIESIAEEDAEVANELREYMFTWDDIANVDRRVMQKILGTVDTKTLSIAIKACPPAVEENLMSNLSSRVREMVAEERELAGAVPLATVLDAREEILRNIRAMIETGEFSPSRAGEELVS